MIAATLELLDRSGIPYCLLHGREQLDEPAVSDVDLAIRPQDLSRVEEILFGSKGLRCVQLLQHESTGYYFVLAAADGQAVRFVRLDFATDYRGQGRLFLCADELLAGRCRHGSVWVSSPATEFSYLLIKKVLKGQASPLQLERLRLLARQLGSAAGAAAARHLGIGQAQEVLGWLDRRDWGCLQEILPVLRSSLRRRALRRRPLLSWLHYWLPELRRIWRRWRHPTGLLVAVLGPDGSGKSTLIRRLPAIVGQAFRRSDAFHLRPGLLPAAGGRGEVNDPHGRPPRSGPVSVIKLLYLALDYWLGYLLRVRPKLVRSSLVLFDRYLPDLRADPRRYRYGGPLRLLGLAGRLVPKPDLYLILDVREKELLERKQEVSFVEAGRQRAAYRSLAAELPNAILLGGGADEVEVGMEAAEAILAHLRWRYLRRRRLWFHAYRDAAWDWLRQVLCPEACQTDSSPRPGGARGEAYWRLSLVDGRGFLFPLAPSRAAAAALQLYSAQHPHARAAKRCLAAGLATGLVQPLLPRPRGLGGSGTEALLEHLQEVLGRRDLGLAISLGTPGPHRKPVVQVLEGSGRTLAYAKIGWEEATCGLVRNEAEMLRRLGSEELHCLRAPTLLHLGSWHGRLVCLQSSPPPKARLAGRRLDAGLLDAVRELSGLDVRRVRLKESLFWEDLNRRIGQLNGESLGAILGRLLERVSSRLRDEELPFHLSHGDFAPWNTLLVDDRPFLFDWEYARGPWLPGYDLLHFLFQTRLLLARESCARTWEMVRQRVIRFEAVGAYWRKLAIPERSIGPLMLLYLLERAACHALAGPGQHQALRRTLILAEVGLADLGWLS